MKDLRAMVRDMAMEIFQNEITLEEKNEKQLLDILRVRDDEVKRSQETAAECQVSFDAFRDHSHRLEGWSLAVV